MNLRVLADGKDIGYLPCCTRKTFEISPGEHSLQVKLEMNWSRSAPTTIHIEEGKVTEYYCDAKYKGVASILGAIKPVCFVIGEGSHYTDEALEKHRLRIENRVESFFIKGLTPLMTANVIGAGLGLMLLIILLLFSL